MQQVAFLSRVWDRAKHFRSLLVLGYLKYGHGLSPVETRSWWLGEWTDSNGVRPAPGEEREPVAVGAAQIGNWKEWPARKWPLKWESSCAGSVCDWVGGELGVPAGPTGEKRDGQAVRPSQREGHRCQHLLHPFGGVIVLFSSCRGPVMLCLGGYSCPYRAVGVWLCSAPPDALLQNRRHVGNTSEKCIKQFPSVNKPVVSEYFWKCLQAKVPLKGVTCWATGVNSYREGLYSALNVFRNFLVAKKRMFPEHDDIVMQVPGASVPG